MLGVRASDRQTDAKTSFAAAHWQLLFPEVVELLKLKKKLNSSGTAETLFPNEGQNGCKTRLGSVTTRLPCRKLKHQNCKEKKEEEEEEKGWQRFARYSTFYTSTFEFVGNGHWRWSVVYQYKCELNVTSTQLFLFDITQIQHRPHNTAADSSVNVSLRLWWLNDQRKSTNDQKWFL